MTQAFFLVAHGSRSPHGKTSLERLADYFRTLLPAEYAVGTGALEFEWGSLAQQLVEFRSRCPADCQQIYVIPVFLLPGTHVRDDIPDEIQAAQELFSPGQAVQLTLTAYLGSHPEIERILRNRMTLNSADAWVLLGHGSSRPEGDHVIEQLAQSLSVYSAFWASEPKISAQAHTLFEQGVRSIGVIPYFLFAGRITAAIAAQIEEIDQRYPDRSIKLLSPLEPSRELARALLELTQQSEMNLRQSVIPASVA
ncbi:MAG: sirohydrochlorin chelatase [Cyanobacteria bacterium P01_F01_bin.42]